MMNKFQTIPFLAISALLLCTLFSSCKKDDVSFTFSPTDPCAGATVYFTNNTSEGEEWSWTFGDGSTSTSKSPRHVYRQPGDYSVILKVDNKASRTFSATIHVHDTVPSISQSDSIVYIFTPVTFTALCYNPFSYSLKYRWELPSCATIVKGDTASQSITVYFREHGSQLPFCCHLDQGGTEWTLYDTVFVEDKHVPSILLAKKDTLYTQRLFPVAYETATAHTFGSNTLTAPRQLIVDGESVYIFNADTTTAGSLAHLTGLSSAGQEILHNAVSGAGQGFDGGVIKDGEVYWTAGDAIYHTRLLPGQTFTAADPAMLFAGVADLGYGLTTGLHSAGIHTHNNVWLYAYGKGIYRFTNEDIKSGSTPAAGSILTDYEIQHFAIDRIAGKIYFSTTDGLFICNLDGSTIRPLDDKTEISAVAVDNANNLVLWATSEGVYTHSLITTANNLDTELPEHINNLTDITAIAVYE